MSPTRTLILSTALAVFATFAGRAQAATAASDSAMRATGPGRPDPLAPYIEEALRVDLDMAQARLADKSSVAALHEARGLFLPSIGINSRYSRMSGVLNLGDLVNPAYAALNRLTGSNDFPTDIDLTQPRKHETSARLTQPIYNAEIFGNYSLARARREAQRMRLATTARKLTAEVQTAYLQAASARRVLEIYEATLAILQENERVSSRLLAAGRATPEAVYRARADRSSVEQELAEARETRRAADRVFNQILRRPLESAVEVIPDSVFEWPLSITADSAVAHALASREELHEADADVRAARSAGKIATSTYLPSLSAVVDYGFQSQDFAFRGEDDFWVASLVASWRIFDGGQGLARRDAARYEAERGRTLRQGLEDQIEIEVRTAYGQAEVARSAIATADTRLEAARRTFELVRRRYEEGVAPQIEFVDARSAYTSAELNRVLTGYRYAIRWVELERASALRAPAF